MSKNLTNCTLKEFMVQTRLIKHSVESWLKMTDIMNIRKEQPDIPDDATEEERNELLREQGMKNANAMFDSIMDKHPEETVKLIALLCFVPESEIDNYPMTYYLSNMTEMLQDKTVWDFFISLAVAARRLGITTD